MGRSDRRRSFSDLLCLSETNLCSQPDRDDAGSARFHAREPQEGDRNASPGARPINSDDLHDLTEFNSLGRRDCATLFQTISLFDGFYLRGHYVSGGTVRYRRSRKRPRLAWHLGRSGKKVAVVERRWVGGSCPAVACLPSKNELWSARGAHLVQNAAQFGTLNAAVRTGMG